MVVVDAKLMLALARAESRLDAAICTVPPLVAPAPAPAAIVFPSVARMSTLELAPLWLDDVIRRVLGSNKRTPSRF